MRMRAVHLIVVIPCYNEETRLDRDAFRRFAPGDAQHQVEFLFVNDGSRDSTLRLLQSLVGENPARFSLLDVQPNQGKAEAVRRGIVAALDRKPDAVGFWDADLATPLEEIDSFLDTLASRPSIEMVFGARVRLLGREISRHPSRHYVGRMGATLIASSLGIAVYDTQCGAKIFRRNANIETIFARPFLSRWIFDVEIIARYIQMNGRDAAVRAIVELPIRVWRDIHGSKVKSHDFIRALRDLWRIRRAYR